MDAARQDGNQFHRYKGGIVTLHKITLHTYFYVRLDTLKFLNEFRHDFHVLFKFNLERRTVASGDLFDLPLLSSSCYHCILSAFRDRKVIARHNIGQSALKCRVRASCRRLGGKEGQR